ncbi:MAG: M43 family zinc metalloprotease [Bacteroidia bacterium]|nr:M43 family zinc metalloprotease [Bacteroidia bacterium]
MKAFSLTRLLSKILFLTLFAFIFAPLVSAQHVHTERCGLAEAEKLLREEGFQSRSREDYHQWIENLRRQSNHVQRDVLTIPVVVHVVHDDEAVGIGGNITASQINSQIDVLNEDFRRRLNSNGYNTHPDGADIEIEFCLALVDPNGNLMPEPGIDRVNRLLEGFRAPPYGITYHQNTIQQATYWDPTKYLNIWVSPLANDFLGFTILPSDSLEPVYKDGVTITPTSFGRKGSVQGPYNLGRTTTHEVGHWLGLEHIWGDGGCGVDDGCADTPPSDQPNYGCPTTAPANCGTPDMFENYMDYTDDACMNVFTQCQKNIMRAVMANASRRRALLSSTVCQGTGAPLARFDASQRFACQGSQIQFFNESLNTTTSWTWSFPGGSPSSSTLENPVVTYANPGQYNVSLTVSNTIGNSSLTKNTFINITPNRDALLYEQDFESGLEDWTVVNSDNEETWELSSVAGSSNGDFAVSVRMFVYSSTGEIDELISPNLDFSSYFDMELAFDHAYRSFAQGASQDSLIIRASIDGGQNYPYLLFRDAENGSFNFATASFTSNDFVPTSDADWCYQGSQGAQCKLIDLSQFSGESNVRLKFIAKNGYGNNLYIDNIKIFGSCVASTVNVEPVFSQDIKLYPNPIGEEFWLELPEAEDVKLELWSTHGQLVNTWELSRNQTERPVALQANGIAQGSYILKIRGNGWEKFRKILK